MSTESRHETLDLYAVRPERALCDYCPRLDRDPVAATIYCPICRRNLCDVCLEAH